MTESRFDKSHDANEIRAHDRQRQFTEVAWSAITERIGAALSRDAPVLDLGAGTCLYTERLARDGRRLVAVDISPSMLLAARERGCKEIPMLVGDGHDLPFTNQAFGSTMLFHVAHLFGEPDRVFREIARVLKPDAPLIVNPGNETRSDVEDAARTQFLNGLSKGDWTPPRSRDAAIASLIAQICQAGFMERPRIQVQDRLTRSIGETIDTFEKNPFGLRGFRQRRRIHKAAKRVRRWALDEFGSLDARYELELNLTFLVLTRA